MLYHSTRSPSVKVSLKQAILRPLPDDGGLYMPEFLPVLNDKFWQEFRGYHFAEICYYVANAFFGEDVPAAALREIVDSSITFDAPLVEISERDYILELFHGPTLAFKDFGARFMARLMAWLTRDDDQLLNILVATSGDTGGAVASAFLNIPGTRVIILYPKNKISFLQEKQLTTLGGNIIALEVEGTFDDCQALVKSAFSDIDLSTRLNLTSANSINLARLVPQIFYYIYSASKFPAATKLVYSVPSGNFGNLTAGLLAAKLGLPVQHFIAATNQNNVVPRYLMNGEYTPQPTVSTLSNAMDVGAPSNFSRMQFLFSHSWASFKSHIHGEFFSDDETRAAIREASFHAHYQIDPHGAVAWMAATKWRAAHPDSVTITLETAHPAKFVEVMEAELGKGSVTVPVRLSTLSGRAGSSVAMPNDRKKFHAFLDSL